MSDEELEMVLDLLDKCDGYDLVLYDGPMIMQISRQPERREPTPFDTMGPEAN